MPSAAARVSRRRGRPPPSCVGACLGACPGACLGASVGVFRIPCGRVMSARPYPRTFAGIRAPHAGMPVDSAGTGSADRRRGGRMKGSAVRQHWAWVVTLVVLLGLYMLTDAALVDTGNPNLVPSMLLLGSLVVPATFVSFARGWSGRQLVPASTLWTAILVGGAVGVVIAGVLEYNTVRRLGELSMLGVGLIEEGSKLAVAALFLLVLRRYSSMGA